MAAVSNPIDRKCAKRRKKPLFPQYIQSCLDLAQRVRIAGDGDPTAVQVAGLVQLPQLFERLPAMVVSGGVLGIGRQDRLELLNGAFEVARTDVLHRQTVTCKGVDGIVRQQLPQDL